MWLINAVIFFFCVLNRFIFCFKALKFKKKNDKGLERCQNHTFKSAISVEGRRYFSKHMEDYDTRQEFFRASQDCTFLVMWHPFGLPVRCSLCPQPPEISQRISTRQGVPAVSVINLFAQIADQQSLTTDSIA